MSEFQKNNALKNENISNLHQAHYRELSTNIPKSNQSHINQN